MRPPAFDLQGRRALVTGASSGLGAHFARTLARAGAHVILAARRNLQLEAAVGAIVSAGGSGEAIALDVSQARSIDEMWARLGAVDILVNNAGVALAKPALELKPEEWDQVLDVNLRGAFFVARGAARAMREAGAPGAIINVASILGLRQGSGLAAYAASKAALIQMTKSTALEWARYSIRVNALCPGYIETDLNRAYFTSEAGQAMVRRIPQRRLGRPEDLDGALLLIASDASRYMTGSVLAIDGGHLVSGL